MRPPHDLHTGPPTASGWTEWPHGIARFWLNEREARVVVVFKGAVRVYHGCPPADLSRELGPGGVIYAILTR